MNEKNYHNHLFIQTPVRITKAWGWEDIIINNDKYCSKILHFYKDAKFSLHFHIEKHETWYVSKGKLLLNYTDVKLGKIFSINLVAGDVVVVPQGHPHQLTALEESDIFEASTPHKDNDSYRISPGDSQLDK